MPTQSESLWRANKERQDQCVQDYLNGIDSEDVLRARLYGLGLRGDYLESEMRFANTFKVERTPAPKIIYMVMVMERGRIPEYIRFINEASAIFAVGLLRKQPGVIFASRATDYPVIPC